MAALLALYVWLVAGRAVALLASGIELGEPVAITMGAAMIVLPLIGLWALGRELWFGWRADRLAARLEADGLLPDDEVELAPSGRPKRSEADRLFESCREAAEAAPDDWRAWFRLSVVYDAAGDRRRARQAARTAIRLERAAR